MRSCPIIAFEGLPGAGKTTAINEIVKRLRKKGLKVAVVDIEETGDAPQLRSIARKYHLGHMARILLFWVLRINQYEHAEVLREENDLVIADRFWGSTLAFDVYGNQVPEEILDWVGNHIERHPDLTLFFDASVELVRRRKRKEDAKTMKEDDFAYRVMNGYRKLYERNEKWEMIDATQTIENVVKDCIKAIEEILG